MAITRWFLISSVCVALVGSAAAQNMASGSVVGRVGRPRVFPQGVPSVQVAVSPGTSVAQLSEANFRLASNEETEGMELTLEKYEGAFESLSLQQVRQIWPALDRQHEVAFKNVFEAFRQTSWTRSLRLE